MTFEEWDAEAVRIPENDVVSPDGSRSWRKAPTGRERCRSTDDANLWARRCDCGDCVRIRRYFDSASNDDRGDTPDRMDTGPDSRDSSRVERAPAAMPLRSRIWGADR